MTGDYLGSGWKRQGIYIARMTKRVSETEKHVFKNGVDIPCLATSHTNNRARVNRAHDESSKSNDNRVIWVGSDMEGRPLFQCTTARYCHKNTRQRRCHEPCGCWEWHANLRKINNNTVSSWVRKQCGLGTSGCSWGGHAYLKSSIIAELNELLNTVNMASVLQGKDPPPLFNYINYIWNVSWRLITHLTVL